MPPPQRWRCWRCATTLNTRRSKRITVHQNICNQRPPRPIKQSESGDKPVVKLQTKSKGESCLIDWKFCPIKGCGVSIRKKADRLDHLNKHRKAVASGSRKEDTQTDHMTQCLKSLPGTSSDNNCHRDRMEIDSIHPEPVQKHRLPDNSSHTSVYYQVSRPTSRIENVRLRSTEERVSFRLTEKGLELARQGHILALMDTIIREIIESHRGQEHARLRIIFDSDSMDYAFSGTFHEADEFDVFGFLEQLERILNSKQSISTDENIHLYVQSIGDPMSGGTRHVFRRKDYANTQDFFRQRKSIFYINNKDNSCFFMALAAGLRFMGITRKNIRKEVKRGSKRDYSRWLRFPHCNKKLRLEASVLRTAANHPANLPVTPQLFPIIQRILNEKYRVQLLVLNSEDGNTVYFAGEPPRPEKFQLHLTFGANHYCYIKQLKTYLNQHRLCHLCYKSYLTVHRCSLKCDRCETKACFQHRKDNDLLANLSALTKCEKCGLLFYSDMCLGHHQNKNVCQNYTMCKKCERIHKKDIDHDCEHFDCPTCKEKVSVPHLCSTQTPNISDKSKFIFVIFDIETYVDEYGVHKPYLICFDRVCELCWDKEFEGEDDCVQCGERTKMFYGVGCISEFCSYLIKRCNEGAILLSHNGSGFDNYFIIDHIISEKGSLDVITRGHRFMSVNIGRNIRMLDTYLFFFCKLSALSSIFEIPEQKGYFPFKMASFESLNSVFTTHPSPEQYGYDQMSEKERIQFMAWYSGVSNTIFDFREAAILYCRMDVKLLRKASMQFRKLVSELFGIDPWQNALTLSHLASLIYRKCFMSSSISLGIMPTAGYTDMYRKQTSLLCVKYIEWIMKETGRQIIHGGTMLEPRFLGRYPCDGIELKDTSKTVSLRNTKQIWDIRGCFFHAHRENCTINRRVPHGEIAYTPDDLNKKHPLKKSMTYRDIIDADNLRVKWFESRGVPVSIVYECEIEQLKKENFLFAAFYNDHKIWDQYVLPIGPRDALFGGRVTVGRLLCELTQEQQQQGYQILYDDFISLYPSVMRDKPYPIGHPEIIKFPMLPTTLSLDNIDEYFGLMKVNVLPPQTLLHGVLPYRANGKLLFPLCIKCAIEFKTRDLEETDFDEIGNIECKHSHKERTFWGVFCSVELKLALQMGYQIIQVSEIWNYAKGDLFSTYVNGMISMKIESSGYPDHCITPDQKQDYINQMAEDNIILEPSNIRKCNGKRQIGKLFANSLWGKICQGIEITDTEFVKEPKDLSRLLRDPTADITDVVFLNRGECLCVSSKRKKEVQRNMQLYSPTVGSFVTAYGRIRLYNLMHESGSNFIYGDTDSVIYMTGPGMYRANHGTKIGDVASEINWPNDYITNFVAVGPKTYSFQTKSGKSSVKAKGLSLKCKIGEIINFDHLKTIVLGQCKEIGPLFYDILEEPLRGRLMTLHAQKYESNKKPFLLLPQKRIKKNKTSIELENSEMIKILQCSGADKRRILRHASLRTVEFGFKTPDNFLT